MSSTPDAASSRSESGPATSPASSRRSQRGWWIFGSVTIAIGVGVAIWFGLSASVGRVTWTSVSYKIVDAKTAEITFDVDMPPGTEAVCTVRALARNFSTVGTLEVPIPAATDRTTVHRTTIATTSEAVTAVVQFCRKL